MHETLNFAGRRETLHGDLLHDAYPTLTAYLDHMQRYSTLGAEIAAARGRGGRGLPGFLNGVLFNPLATFLYNYVLRAGFLDGREGLLLHLYHSAYVSWKYAKAWERKRHSQRIACRLQYLRERLRSGTLVVGSPENAYLDQSTSQPGGALACSARPFCDCRFAGCASPLTGGQSGVGASGVC